MAMDFVIKTLPFFKTNHGFWELQDYLDSTPRCPTTQILVLYLVQIQLRAVRNAVTMGIYIYIYIYIHYIYIYRDSVLHLLSYKRGFN